MLEVRGLEAFYGQAQALFGVDLDLRAGQMLVLQGLNGAGKSTLLKALIGLEVRTRGSIGLATGHGLACQELSSWPPHKRARAGLGYVAEDRRLFTALSVRENLRVGGGSADREAWVLDLFPLLKPMLARPAALMSGGEQQLLAIARTLMGSPRVLLLDEPCEGISPLLVESIRDALVDLRTEGLGLLVAEQNRLIAQAADRVITLVAGKVQR